MPPGSGTLRKGGKRKSLLVTLGPPMGPEVQGLHSWGNNCSGPREVTQRIRGSVALGEPWAFLLAQVHPPILSTPNSKDHPRISLVSPPTT